MSYNEPYTPNESVQYRGPTLYTHSSNASQILKRATKLVSNSAFQAGKVSKSRLGLNRKIVAHEQSKLSVELKQSKAKNCCILYTI